MKLLPLFLAVLTAPVLTSASAHAQATTPDTPAVPGTPVDPATPAPIAPAEAAPANPDIDPAAVALLDQSAKAYGALTGLSMNFKATDTEGSKTTNTSGEIALARPNKARVTFKAGSSNVLFLSDGSNLIMQTRSEEYMSQPTKGQNAQPAVLQRVPSALGLILPSLASGQSPLSLRQIPWQKASMIPDGVNLTATVGGGNASLVFRLYFGSTDHLLRRVEAEITARGQKTVNITTLSNILVDAAVPASTFTFTPAAGAKLVKEPSYYSPKLKVGVKPFALTGRDLNGNQYPWSRYAGKVVLLDFWATWCGPCVAEVPTILQNLKKYQGAGFRVLGVSLDESKTELQNFIKTNKLPYPNLFDGKGPQNADSQRYEVQAIPFSLLIGKDGKIAAVNPRGPALEIAIQKALKAK